MFSCKFGEHCRSLNLYCVLVGQPTDIRIWNPFDELDHFKQLFNIIHLITVAIQFQQNVHTFLSVSIEGGRIFHVVVQFKSR